jgi:coenzyme F420-reducing hydrogenase gamma subunit
MSRDFWAELPGDTSKGDKRNVVILNGAVCDERRRDRLKLLRAIMIVVILVTALSFGACAQHKEATVTTSAGTTGYAK